MLKIFKEKVIREIIKPYRWKILSLFLLVGVGTFATLLDAQFMRHLFDNFLTDVGENVKNNYFKQLLIFLGFWILAALTARVFNTLSNYFIKHYTDKIGLDIFYRGYSHLLTLPLRYHENNKSGENVQKLSKARQDITQLFDIIINTFFHNFVIFIVVLSYAFYLHWGLALVVIANLPIFALTTWWKTKQVKEHQKEINKKLELISGNATESLNHIFLIKSLGNEERENKDLEENDQLRHELNQKKIRAQNEMQFIQGTLIQLSRMILIFFGAYFAYKGIITGGEVFAILFYSFFLYNPLYQLANMYTTYHEARTSIQRVEELLLIEDKLKILKPEINEEIKGGPGIILENVSFDYETKKDALQNINLKIPKGKRIAFVGPSGGGKSTLLRLLLRLEDVSKGKVILNGKNIKNYTRNALSKSIGIVPQESHLFSNTVKFNVTYGVKWNYKEKDIWDALKHASAFDFIDKLDNKLDTLIGENGVKLSGGQRQRLSLARAFLLKTPMLIFDEATSALDNATEKVVKNALNELKEDKTVVMVAHRLSTIEDVDLIYVLDNGKVVEQGNYEELMNKKGLLFRLAKKSKF
jgi:ATP-binding cassette, subfamily B, bacterial